MILIYPVISMSEKMGHSGSRANLLGQSAGTELINAFSNETHVTSDTPPTFLTHAGDDKVVPVSNSLIFYEALHQHDVPADMHIYSQGGHGYGKEPAFEEWFGRCLHWLKQVKMMP
jgi:dipeptidyl aminopeptidase/acylaminoacyl peptidase